MFENSNLNTLTGNLSLNGTSVKNIQIDGAAMNSITKNGFYTIVGPVSDSPGFSSFGLIVIGNNGDYCVQIACAFGAGGIKVRRCGANVWTAWNSITIT